MKKKIIITVAVVLVTAIFGTGIFFGVRNMKMNEYKNAEITLPNDFTITAHTGCVGTEENSVESMEIGIANGANIIEFDVHFLKDGTPVLAHDEPTGNELKLEVAFQFLANHKEIRANVDMKATDNMSAVQSLAEEYGVMEQIFFTGVGVDFLDAVKTGSPDVSYYLNVDVEKSKATDKDYLLFLVEKVKNAGAVGINFNYKSATKELVEIFHENGLLVSIWTVNDEYNMYKILSFAPDNITTRHPDELSRIVKEIK